MEEYERCMERLLPPEEARPLDYNQLYEGMEVLAEFEKLANSRVVDSGVLRGMNLEDIKKARERLILQDGCKTFFQKIGKTREKLNLDIHILSYCWCAELIRSAFSSDGCLGLNVHSNKFAFEESVSSGQIDRKNQSPLDKVEKFKSIKSDRRYNTITVCLHWRLGVICFAYWRQILALLLDQAQPCGK